MQKSVQVMSKLRCLVVVLTSFLLVGANLILTYIILIIPISTNTQLYTRISIFMHMHICMYGM